MGTKRLLIFALALSAAGLSAGAAERTLTREDLLDKIAGFWHGQLAGNYMGFPFENVYVDEPVPVLVDRIYTWEDAGMPVPGGTLRLNAGDHRGFIPIVAAMFEGAFADDDTDIEYVTLHAVEQYGLDITYPEIAEAWKTHINRKIWVANRTARDLMDEGLIPPETGKKDNNRNWFQIDPQLVNEIWSAFYPGMTRHAMERADWGARITNDDWGVHPTLAYAVMYSAAFFESDPEKLVDLALKAVPKEGPFYEGMVDVISWHGEYDDWRDTRKQIHQKYFRYLSGGVQAPVSVVSSLVNGLCGVMAVLYGGGDFAKTVGIAVSAGYDCDNQAATCAGLVGVMRGADAVPESITLKLPAHGRWETPFNNRYINWTRDKLPIDNRLTDLVERTAAIAEQAILQNGGRKTTVNGKEAYVVPCDF